MMRERTYEKMFEMLRRVWYMPLASNSDVAGWDHSRPKDVTTLMGHAMRLGLAGHITIGRTYKAQARHYLHRKGIEEVRTRFGLPIPWQVKETALHEQVRRLRLYEPIYRFVPRLFRIGAVRTPSAFPMDPGDDPRELILDETLQLEKIIWVRDTLSTPAHAIVQYRTRAGDPIWVPIIGVGLHHGDILTPDELSSPFRGLDTLPEILHGHLADAAPPGVMVVVLDRLAGLFVRRQVPSHIPMAIVDAEGHIIKQMDPVAPLGRVQDLPEDGARVGAPEDLGTWVETEAGQSSVLTVPARRIFEWVNWFPGSSQKSIAQGVGHPPSKVTGTMARFEAAGLVAYRGNRPYMDRPGRTLAAQSYRVHPNVSHGRFGIYTLEDSCYWYQQRHHDDLVAKIAGLFWEAGIAVAAGTRLEIPYGNNTTLKPDLWVLIPIGDGMGLWHAVEIERTALAPGQVPGKLGPWRTVRDEGELWPLLMVPGRGRRGEKGKSDDLAAAFRYMEQGDDLPMLIMPTWYATRGLLVSHATLWLRAGHLHPIDHLKDVVDRPDLLEYRVPPARLKPIDIAHLDELLQ